MASSSEITRLSSSQYTKGIILHRRAMVLAPNFCVYHILDDSAVIPRFTTANKSAVDNVLFKTCPSGAATSASER
jgi:hypothetical protein